MELVNLQSRPPASSDLAEEDPVGIHDISAKTCLERFLIYGGSSYSAASTASRKHLSSEAESQMSSIVSEHGCRVVILIHQISTAKPARAPRNSYAAQLLGFCAAKGDVDTKRLALKVLPFVCRIPTDLNIFINNYRHYGGGWGRSFKRAVQNWHVSKKPANLARLLSKYGNREGWKSEDRLRLAHINPTKFPFHAPVLKWFTKDDHDFSSELPVLLDSLNPDAKSAVKALGYLQAVEIIKDNPNNVGLILDLVKAEGLPFQVIPTTLLKSMEVWSALLPTLGLTALLRNTRRFRDEAFFSDPSFQELYISKISDESAIAESRIHPFGVLQAYLALASDTPYANGTSVISEDAYRAVSGALSNAFLLAFGNVTPTNKRMLIALDVSGSMSFNVLGTDITCAQASAFMAYYYAKTEPNVDIRCFSSRPLEASPRRWTESLEDLNNLFAEDGSDALALIEKGIWRRNFGTTDCSLPFLEATRENLSVDVFMVFTDSETNSNSQPPSRALQQYREASGIDAKLVVNAMLANKISIADPSDPGQLDVCGFDAGVPHVLSEFMK